MISWIQRTFQQHFKAVFMVLLAVTIISFIITIGATPGIGRADRRVVSREFFGYNLGSQSDLQQLLGDARISAELQLGYGGLDDDQLRNYAFQRAAALHFADQIRLPAASESDLKAYIQTLRVFAGPDGRFDAARYAAFRENLSHGLMEVTDDEVARVMLDDLRIDRAQRVLDGPGYVLAEDVRDQLFRTDTLWTLGVATVDYASYRPAIQPTDLQLQKYYTDNSFRYQIPPRLVATCVEFPAADYLSQVNLTEAEVRAHYDADPAKFAPKPAVPKAPALSPDASYAAARPQVEADLRLERARNLAAKAASDLAVDLYNEKVEQGAALDAYLAGRKLAAKPLAPFTREAGPAEFGGSHEISEAAFQLEEGRYFTDALSVPSGAIVLFKQGVLPARQPLLAEVRSKVLADYVDNQRREDFIALGRSLRGALEAKLRSGEPFGKAVAEVAAAQSVKIDASMPAPFSLLHPPPTAGEPVLGSLDRLSKGQVSDMVATADKGYLVYAIDEKTPDLSPANPRVAQTRAQLAFAAARFDAGSYLSQMVSDELKRSGAAAAAP